MTRWYRAYEGTVSDAKLAEAALIVGCSRSVVIAAWHAILENAASLNEEGRIDIPSRRVAAILCEPFQTIETVFSSFESVGLIADSRVTNWKKRQYVSDNSTERSRKSRERQRNDEEDQCNGNAALQNENETSPSVYDSVSVSSSKTVSEKITDEFEIWYQTYPRHVGRGAALRAYRTARNKAEPLILLAGARQAAAQYAQSDPKFIPHPATWLNGERWLDQPPPTKADRNDPFYGAQ